MRSHKNSSSLKEDILYPRAGRVSVAVPAVLHNSVPSPYWWLLAECCSSLHTYWALAFQIFLTLLVLKTQNQCMHFSIIRLTLKELLCDFCLCLIWAINCKPGITVKFNKGV